MSKKKCKQIMGKGAISMPEREERVISMPEREEGAILMFGRGDGVRFMCKKMMQEDQ